MFDLPTQGKCQRFLDGGAQPICIPVGHKLKLKEAIVGGTALKAKVRRIILKDRAI